METIGLSDATGMEATWEMLRFQERSVEADVQILQDVPTLLGQLGTEEPAG